MTMTTAPATTTTTPATALTMVKPTATKIVEFKPSWRIFCLQFNWVNLLGLAEACR